MTVLPVVERELRAAAHHSRTWWRRVFTVVAGLLVFGFIYLSWRNWASSAQMGEDLFGWLAGLAMFYALLAGPLATTDCLARERREGTLGLLFLTDLHTYDIVLGKACAASLDLLLGMAAVLPLAAIPFLLGGVDLPTFLRAALVLFNSMFLSLAVGVFASAIYASSRSALGVTLALLFLLTIVWIFFGEMVVRIGSNGRSVAYFYMVCPLYAMAMAMETASRSRNFGFTLNVCATQFLAWCLLAIACLRTRRAWRDLPASERRQKWQTRWERFRLGGERTRERWRGMMLEQNPIAWLEGRDCIQSRVLWLLIFSSAVALFIKSCGRSRSWPDWDLLFPWILFSHYILCIWIAIQAPRRLADDKQSGALELLLCTTTTARQIVHGCMKVLWRRFGRGFAAIVAIDAWLLFLYYQHHTLSHDLSADGFFRLAMEAAVVFPFQAYSMARIGVYEGLARTNAVRATLVTLGKAGLLPWITWLSGIVTIELMQQSVHFRFSGKTAEFVFLGSWIAVQVGVCGVFLCSASWKLRRRFRQLAAPSLSPAWWRRWLRLARRPHSRAVLAPSGTAGLLMAAVITSTAQAADSKDGSGSAFAAEAGVSQSVMRDEWVDKDTGHRVVRLSRLPGRSESFYFHQNAFTKDGDKFVFSNSSEGARNRLFVLDCATRKAEALTEPGASDAVVSRHLRRVYYQRSGSVWWTDLDSRETKEVTKLPQGSSAGTVSADDTLLAGTFVAGGPRIDRTGPRSTWFEQTFEAKRSQCLYTIEIATGKTNIFYRYEGWLGHIQFSPADPGLLMFCHEGPWHKLDRIWNIRVDGSELRLLHRRTITNEIAGHEFWSPDGKMVWFDLQMPRGEKFFLAGVPVSGGDDVRYPIERNQWSVHFNISANGKLFAGDGGAPNMVAHAQNGKWIYLFTPQSNGRLGAERLVNMSKHDYALEPNVNFSPDGKWIIFRGNFDGSPQVYAVEVGAH